MFTRVKRVAERLISRPGVKLSPSGRRYDWRPDLPDFRDAMFSPRPRLEPLPSKVDLRPEMPPVVNQEDIGSCTANAIAACFDYLQMKQLKEPGQGTFEYNPSEYCPSSRLFIYWNERQLMGTPNEDSGAYLRDGIKSLATLGACREAVWEYRKGNLFRTPTSSAFDEAVKYRIERYRRCASFQQVKQALADGYPVAFGFMVFESFESHATTVTGRVVMPRPTERDLGGHAVAAVGYDDESQVVIVRNSWGEEWGDRGYCYMPYAYISDAGLSDDFWSVEL